MALLWIDGFEDSADASAGDFITDLWRHQPTNGVYWSWADAGSCSPVTSPVRTAQTTVTGKSLRMSYAVIAITVPTVTTLIAGFGWQQSSVVANSICGFTKDPTQGRASNPSNGLRLVCNSSMQLEVRNNSTGTILGTSAGTYSINTWYYIEVKYVFGSTTGAIQVKVNGSDVINLTNIDSAGGAASINGFYLQSVSNFPWVYFDDFYLCDASGTTNNDFIGPLSVYTLPPSADSSVQMTPSTGTTNYNLVDEAIANSTDYVTATAANQTDLYTMANLPAGVTPVAIPGVMIRAKSWKDYLSSVNLQLGAKYSSSTFWSANKTVKLTSPMHNYHILEKQPDGTTDWDKTAVDGLEVGIKSV